MSKDNLILFPNKRKSKVSMTQSEAKWMLAGSLMVILVMAIGVNSALFAEKQAAQSKAVAGEATSANSRSIASINPIFKVSWEKRAFEVLEKSKARDLANVGKKPTVFDNFAFGALEGDYLIRKIDGRIAEVQFTADEQRRPKALLERKKFLTKNLGLFSKQAEKIEPIHVENNSDRMIEKFRMIDGQGQAVGTVQVLLDENQNLLSMTVQ